MRDVLTFISRYYYIHSLNLFIFMSAFTKLTVYKITGKLVNLLLDYYYILLKTFYFLLWSTARQVSFKCINQTYFLTSCKADRLTAKISQTVLKQIVIYMLLHED